MHHCIFQRLLLYTRMALHRNICYTGVGFRFAFQICRREHRLF